MKRIAIAVVIALTGITFIAAQPGYFGGPMMGWGWNQQSAPKASTIEGKLSLTGTYPSLQTKDKTYFVDMPEIYYYAVTDKIADGAQAKLEGYELPALPGQDKPGFFVTKATIAGKTYDTTTRGGRMVGRSFDFDGPGPMMGGRGGMMFGRSFDFDERGPMMGGRGMMGRGFAPTAAPEAKSIDGKLVFVDGYPAVQAKDKTYIIRMPEFFEYAYKDKIAEGAQVKADGFELPTLPGQDKPYFAVTKATIAGKTYDFTTPGAGYGRHMRGFGGRW